jgi:CheY-like chemotaxis protein
MKRGGTILVVDDDRAVRRGTADALRKAGYLVLEAGSGGDALAALKAHEGEVNLLLTDVQMQKMDGGELAELVTAERPDVKVMFMSGYTSGAALHDNVRDEGPVFIAKPFVTEVLLRKVRAILKA